MTTHEADRPADIDPVEENEEMGGSDDPTDEQHDPGTDTDADVADADMQEPVEDQPETTWSHEQDAVDEDTDDAEAAEPELVDTDEAYEPAKPELPDEPDRMDAVAVDRTPESDPLQKLAPVGPDTAIDPGTGSYQDRWGAIQAGFIDDPRRTVESASALVAEIWDETVRAITDEREGVDGRWQSTESSTDDLRVAMQDYRALYARLCASHLTDR
jgi:hypothetical protein